MPQTKQWVAHSKHLGRWFYVAIPYRFIYSDKYENTVEDEEFEASRSFPNEGLAKAWLHKRLTELGEGWHGRIERGKWEEESFDDKGYGWVRDAAWITDERYSINAWQGTDGTIEFEIAHW